jgi:hypothetical protein
VIEPHLEQEAQQRKQHMTLQVAAAAQSTGGHAQAPFDAPRDPLNQYHHSHHPQQQQYQLPVYVPTGRMASNSYQAQLGGGGMDAILGGRELAHHDARADSPSSHHVYHAQQQQQQQQHPPPQHYQPPDGPPTKRTRTARGDLSATYSAQDVYAPQPFPLPHSSAPYATGEVYQPPLAGGSRYPSRMYSDAHAANNHNAAVAATAYEHVWDSRTSPDGSRSLRQRGPFPGGMPPGGSTEMYSLPAPAAHRPPPQTHSSPRTRAAARRSSPPKQPLSSSDPTFSSFVDAANALTGMARAPSDPALNGTGAGGDAVDEEAHAHSLARRSMGMSTGDGGLRHSSSSASGHGGASSGYALPRPSTPERQVVKLPGAPNGGGGGGSGGGDGATAEGAAELMLFLAASPSPVQNRKAPPPPTLGDGMPTKGRRLFSGMGTGAEGGGDASASFGGELDPFGGGGNSSRSHDIGAINNNSNNNSNSRSVPASAPFATASPSADPSKHFATTSSSLSHAQQQQQQQPQDPSSQTAFMPSAPATPGQRQRQPSLGGAWESFINASPSPKRGTATRRSRGGGGGGIYGSSEHADAIGAADGGSGGGRGGIGGGPGNGQATVTW